MTPKIPSSKVKKDDIFSSAADDQMIYIKSTLVGIVTLFAGTIVYLICTIFLLMRRYQPPPNGMVAINLPVLLSRPLYWLLALAAFALGFYWEIRKSK